MIMDGRRNMSHMSAITSVNDRSTPKSLAGWNSERTTTQKPHTAMREVKTMALPTLMIDCLSALCRVAPGCRTLCGTC